MSEKPWGPIDPNSQHQVWSRWTTVFQAQPPIPDLDVIIDNARRFFALLFNSTVGRVKATISGQYVELVCEIEGPAAHDADLRADAIFRIREHFVRRGFGHADAAVTVALLAGDSQDGQPPTQLIVMPEVINPSEVAAP